MFSKMIVELENYLLAYTDEKDYQFPSDIKIVIEKDKDLKIGEVRIKTKLSEDQKEKVEEPKNVSHTQIISPEEASELGLYSSSK